MLLLVAVQSTASLCCKSHDFQEAMVTYLVLQKDEPRTVHVVGRIESTQGFGF